MNFLYQHLVPNFFRCALSTLFITSIFFISACDTDDDHDHHDHAEHADVDGFLLQTLDNKEIYREFKGATTGNILVKSGQSLELSVTCLDDDGNKIMDFDLENQPTLKLSEYEKSIISLEVRKDLYPYTFLISGLSNGQTSAKLELMHEGHADYTSTNRIPVTVE